MYLTTLRSASLPVVANLRSIAPRRFTSTATQQRTTRSWRSSAVRFTLAAGTLYYFNTSLVFAEAASQTVPVPTHPDDDLPAKNPVTERQIHIQANTETNYEKNLEPTETRKPRSDMATNDAAAPDDKSQQGAFNPETGEFNWDCSCLGGMAHGPCGEEFKSAFSCFMLSTDEPKGMNCINQFMVMQECFKKYPDVYGTELAGDEEGDSTPSISDEQPDTPSASIRANLSTSIEADTASNESKRTHKSQGPNKKVNAERI